MSKKDYTDKQALINEQHFQRGAFAAFSYVLNYLNTLDTRQVDKEEIYKAVFEMHPRVLSVRPPA